MQYQITGKQVDIGDALQTHVKDGLDEVVGKYTAGRPTDANIIFSKSEHEHVCAQSTLQTSKPIVFMELHTPDIASEYERFMDAIGYEHFELDGSPIDGPIGSRHIISKPT